mgnify:CR=1 FL=1
MKQNYASIITTLGGGAHGYLGGLIIMAAYNILTPDTPFEAPVRPGPQPVIEGGTTVIATGNIF